MELKKSLFVRGTEARIWFLVAKTESTPLQLRLSLKKASMIIAALHASYFNIEAVTLYYD